MIMKQPAAATTGLSVADRIVHCVAELPDRTSPDDWPEAMLVTADELRMIVTAVTVDEFHVGGSGYEAGFDAGYDGGYAAGLDESAGDPRVERLEAGFRAVQDATNGEYSREDHIVLDALQAGREFAVRLARREQHIIQLIAEREAAEASVHTLTAALYDALHPDGVCRHQGVRMGNDGVPVCPKIAR